MNLESRYRDTHDLHVSAWGPFSKLYYGLSHIADPKKGLRFDFSVIPSYYRTKYMFPDALRDCGIHPWETTADLSYYSYRYEMEWKDKVYADVSYYTYDENTRIVRCCFVNNTDEKQNTALSFMASIEPPLVSLYDRRLMEYAYYKLPEEAVYIDALSYEELTYHTPRPADHLVFGGLFRGEKRMSGFVGGSALADGFGDERGDRAVYRFQIEKRIQNAVLMVRYCAEHANVFEIDGSIQKQIILPKSEQVTVHQFPIGTLEARIHEMILTAHGAGGIAMDGFVVCGAEKADKVIFEGKRWNRKPELERSENSVILDYEDTAFTYGIKWQENTSIVKQYSTDCINSSLRKTSNCIFEKYYDNGGEGHYTVPMLFPFYLKPHGTETVYAFVTSGTKEQVKEKIQTLSVEPERLESLYQERRAGRIRFRTNTAGQEYKQGISLMAANIQNNIVFPIYVHGDYIRHNTPGKDWDCLYTWDSGFIGLALAMLSEERALDILNAYMTEPGFPHAAFVHFGSPVPVQFYLFLEIVNRYGTKEHLEYFYPKLKQYYEFLAGKSGGSTTNRLSSDLLRTWDYFYNSGGWDDYPPQEYMHEKGMADLTAPVITNCHMIRIGKMMAVFARKLERENETEAYLKDGKRFEKALQDNAWDAESGYFGYVVHDKNGIPKEILRDKDGKNFNMGLDGVYPLVAGIATRGQKKVLLNHLKSEQELWTPIGISTVDQSAPYFNPCGYWNGAVWMAHQWFLFKTMLDLNETDFARKIALTALELWKKETNLTYNCYEHFLVQSGRGAGWHNFSALSGPVVNWFFYYFVIGNFTCGFEVFVENRCFEDDFSGFRADLTIEGENEVAVLLTLQEGNDYRFTYQGKKAKAKAVFDGVYEIVLPARTQGEFVAEKRG